jgi:hypothetical protein
MFLFATKSLPALRTRTDVNSLFERSCLLSDLIKKARPVHDI